MWLAIDTAMAGLSVALIDAGRVVASEHSVLGRGHAEKIVPVVASVIDGAGGITPDCIVVNIGPGSFTGLRIGIAAARALGLAWDIPVHGMTATALIAAQAFAQSPGLVRVAAVLDAGRGQLYLQIFEAEGLTANGPVEALTPAQVQDRLRGMACSGPGVEHLPLGDTQIIHRAWPQARDAWLLPASARRLQPSPLYVRAPDAVAHR